MSVRDDVFPYLVSMYLISGTFVIHPFEWIDTRRHLSRSLFFSLSFSLSFSPSGKDRLASASYWLLCSCCRGRRKEKKRKATNDRRRKTFRVSIAWRLILGVDHPKTLKCEANIRKQEIVEHMGWLKYEAALSISPTLSLSLQQIDRILSWQEREREELS